MGVYRLPFGPFPEIQVNLQLNCRDNWGGTFGYGTTVYGNLGMTFFPQTNNSFLSRFPCSLPSLVRNQTNLVTIEIEKLGCWVGTNS